MSSQDIITVSGTESIDVTISETQEKVSEDVFICPIYKYTMIAEERLISKAYNMNNAKNSSLENYFPGRFIFKRNHDNGSVEIVGLAEIPAKVLETQNIELFYLERRRKQEPG